MLPLLATALLPVLLLGFFILRKDKARPEPPVQLLRAFGFGLLSVIPALLLACLFSILGLVPVEYATAREAVLDSFWGAAIPEEIAKFAMLWLVLRRNPYFDEKVDGIVYAVCVALGFAAAENVLYLIGDAANYVQLGISRAIFAVPGHFCDGVLMGYYYSLARFARASRIKHRALILVAPILAHGLYDSLLFVANISEMWKGILCILFIVFCYRLWKLASRRIAEHLAADGALPQR